MKAVILAAGEGNRMYPLTCARPKVMLRIANKPLIEHLLIASRLAGISDFVFVVGYKDYVVRDYFMDGRKWGVRIEYRLQRHPRGTADALGKVNDLMGDCFLVMNGDVLASHKDLFKLADGTGSALTGIDVDDLQGMGAVEVSDGKVIRIHEKTESPPTNLANAGFYRLTSTIFDAIAKTPLSLRGEYELTDSLQLLINQGEQIGIQKLESWISVTYPWDLIDANKIFIPQEDTNHGIIEKNVTIEGPYTIGKGTIIRSGSYIVGPVIIGSNCDIGPNCFIRPATAIEDNCHIGSSVEIKNSIIMRGTKVPHHNYVGDSVIGENCNLGAGTKIANLRFDNKNVPGTKRRKLGALIGDNVLTGINSCIDAGTTIGDNTTIGPGAIARGNIAPDSRIF
ncbi:MAG: sugar phosphate nucleotidyltransferase [Dehalococcoidales bacterium]|nr:sugar phosphate nucleotidyltransferase [Dehalococcoidales bacterium]